MKSREEFVRHFDELLYKEMLLLLHSSHDVDWMVRCSKNLPGRVTTTLEKMYDFIMDTKDATPSTTKPSGANGQPSTKAVSAAQSAIETPKPAVGGSKLTTSFASGGVMKPATS